ncbi:hypothetical protein NE237_023432 [Protea cynaroides]|uniref:Uncharacterized protein n=1 Tax=Protea cynaroides TaxID=273540 RepID=A0A9Q0HC61_9MAGN|nr:hypothetical protein NE237_023432 [Protea cynaroides]
MARISVGLQGDTRDAGTVSQTPNCIVGVQGDSRAAGIVSLNPMFPVGFSVSDPMLMEASIPQELRAAAHMSVPQGTVHNENFFTARERDLRRVRKRQHWTWREKGKNKVSNGAENLEVLAANIPTATSVGVNSIRAETVVNGARAARSFADVARGFQEASMEGLAEPTSIAADECKLNKNKVDEVDLGDVQPQQVATVEKDGAAGFPAQDRVNPNVAMEHGVNQFWADVSDGDVNESLDGDGTDSFHEEQAEDLNQEHVPTQTGLVSENPRMELDSTMHGSGSERITRMAVGTAEVSFIEMKTVDALLEEYDRSK